MLNGLMRQIESAISIQTSNSRTSNLLANLPISFQPTQAFGHDQVTDLLALLWTVMEANTKFKSFLAQSQEALQLLRLLLVLSWENKEYVARLGLMRLCAYLIHTLSCEQAFLDNINERCSSFSSLPLAIRRQEPTGTFADLLILTIHGLITTSKGNLTSLYSTYCIVILNISSSVRCLSNTASNNLVGLFRAFSAPGFLLGEEGNYRLLSLVLDAMQNVILASFTKNTHLVYAVVQQHDRFETLAKTTFRDALEEVWDAYQLADKARGSEENLNLRSPAIRPLTASTDAVNWMTYPPSQDHGKRNSGSEIPEGFAATEEWYQTWHDQLKLDLILITSSELVSPIKALCSRSLEGGTTTATKVHDYLKTDPLAHLLQDGQITPLIRLQWTDALHVWFASIVWGSVYLRGLIDHNAIWSGTNIRLFQVQTPSSPSPTSSTVPAGLASLLWPSRSAAAPADHLV